ncbi:MAG: hypothetical protein KF841_04945 [Phycisphaerae bacterium]|nr:hypothetical protein [Phycisphaerae bacterium]
MSRTLARRMIGQTLILGSVAIALVLFTVAPNEAQTTTQPSGTTRQPIVTNQFTTTSGSALQARAPGLYTRQAISIQAGTLDPFDGNIPDDTPWVRQTFDMLFLQFVDIIKGLVDSLNLLVGPGNALGGIFNGGLGGGLSNAISNPLTSGAGTSTPIN